MKRLTFCPLSAFMRFVWISEKKQGSFPPNCIKELAFIVERECVYCAVRTGSLYVTEFGFKYALCNCNSDKTSFKIVISSMDSEDPEPRTSHYKPKVQYGSVIMPVVRTKIK
jgi:hypothetical protein